jgi:hypothetical protein
MKPGAIPAYTSVARQSPANLAFSALLFCCLGWAILEYWTVGAHAGALPHLINTLACAPVMGCSLRRFHTACPRRLRAGMAPPGVHTAGRLALALLFAAGAAFGAVLASGSVVLVALLTAAACCMPWTRFRVHRQHLLLSFVALTAGGMLPLLASSRPLTLMVALPAAWCLWTVAALLCICLCGSELLKKRKA